MGVSAARLWPVSDDAPNPMASAFRSAVTKTVRRIALVAPRTWRLWLQRLFPQHVRGGFGERHVAFWAWLWEIDRDSDPRPFVGIWPRGGAKSSSAELGTVALGIRGKRRYALYVRDTQDRADDSVSNIGALLESDAVAAYYPEHAEPLLGKFGNSRGWRRNRLRTAGGFTVDALGLDVAARGVKLEDQRPDLIIFDDIDGRHDTPRATEKKLATIRDGLLQAGSANVAVIAIQNLIIPNGMFSRLADGRADFLTRRVLSGPEPAVRDLVTAKRHDPETGGLRDVITGGVPTWAGQSLAACQQIIDRSGLAAFVRECQHIVGEREGSLWSAKMITHVGAPERYRRVVVGVDPSGGAEEIGIIVAGLGYDGHAYVITDATALGRKGPLHWGREAARLYREQKADVIVAERNFGGDMVESTIKVADPSANVRLVTASRGKDVRAEPVAALYEKGLVHHVGAFVELEAEMTGWVPGDSDSPNRMDALVWAITDLLLGGQPRDLSNYPVIRE